MLSKPQQKKLLGARMILFCAACATFFFGVAHAAALMQDGQDYAAATSTPVTGRSPWLLASSGGAAAASTSAIGIYAGDLTGTTTPALSGLTNIINPAAHLQINKAGTSSRTYYRGVGTPFTNGSIYFSFLMNVSVNPATSDEILCELSPAVPGGSYPANPSANDPLTLHMQKGVDSSHFNLGIQSLGGTVSWATTNCADSTDYLVVLDYVFGAGQTSQLFINPIPGAAQPAASANATKGVQVEPANLGTILFWESSSNTTITASYDVMRVDTNWANVVPAGMTNAVANAPAPMRVLFAGDSLLGISVTYSNDIPAILSNLASNLGDSFAYTKIANSSWYLSNHATNPPTTNAIASGSYNLVVLQDQSAAPSLASERASEMLPASQALNTMITNHNAHTMFYETWGYIDGDSSGNCTSYDFPAQYKTNCDGGFGSFLNMNIATRYGYAVAANQLAAAIAPVGLAWANARMTRPTLNFYITNDSLGDRHPNDYGAYLAACVFYSSIFGRSPEGSTYYSDIDSGTAGFLQQLAAQTVLQDPFAPDAYDFATNRFSWAYRWQNHTNPPTAPANTVVISGASAVPSPSVRIDANCGSTSNVWLGTLDTNYNSAGQGRLYCAGGGSLAINGSLIVGKEGKGFVQMNGGTLSVGGPLTLAQQTNSAGQFTLSNGTFFAQQILPGVGNAVFNFQGGQLGFSQFGTAAQPLNLSSSGTLLLTNTTTAHLYGNFSNNTSAVLAIQLGSSSNTLAVSGTAALAGNLNVTLANGFQPTPGQQFNLLTANSVVGNFASVATPAVGNNGIGLVTSLTATSVVATAVNFTPTLTLPALIGGNFQFNISGITGSRYAVQASTNLLNWIFVQTNNAPFSFSSGNSGTVFYRAVYLP
jgi:hypothetical protein